MSPSLKNLVLNMRNLQELYLDGVIISDQGDWWETLSLSLPKLRSLSMRDCNLTSPLNPSFTHLHSLSVLRLDRNDLSTTNLDFFAKFKNLTILTLSLCSLQGSSFPQSIFQVPTLQYLGLSNNELLTGSVPEFLQSSSLTTLDLSDTNFSGSLPHSITNLSMLSMISLSNCSFKGTIPSSIGNLSELVRLDLSFNLFTGPVPVFSMSKKITYVDLSSNGLNGSLSSAHFEGLSNLLYLNLGYNSLAGSIPLSLFGAPSLQKLLLSNNKFYGQFTEFSVLNSALDTLDLSSNQLRGPIPESFFNLTSLNVLLLSFNSFNGTIELGDFKSLHNLTNLGLAYNNLTVRSTSDLSLFPQLSRLNLASCHLYNFPNLTNQSRLGFLDLSNNYISGVIPSWIWEIGNGLLVELNISCNFLVNMQTPFQIPSGLGVLDLHSNRLRGELPLLPSTPMYLDYSSNNFKGTIPIDIGNFTSFASFFSIARNNMTGEIPVSLCSATFLQVLDLSGNSLLGPIPKCLFQSLTALGVLNLGGNNIGGDIPDSFSENCGLQTLDLSWNRLKGRIPSSLANCKLLEVINVGSNNIIDRFPCILKSLSSLHVLVLRSNMLYGNINCPKVNQSWPNLQILDLASNLFTGNINPGSIASWSSMKTENGQSHLHFNFLELNGFYYQDTVTVTVKGLELEFQKISTVLTLIDFSGNKFDGVIPDTIGELNLLYVLNLSRNSFTGRIPESITNLTQLSSLDLSRNQLTGEIPAGLTKFTFLSFFNISYNKLSGRIPFGFQFSTFSASSYDGNTGLCGSPLDRSCDINEATNTMATTISRTDFDWLFIVTGLGYCTGAALITVSLIFSKKWRETCEDYQDKLLMFICPGYGSGRRP